MKRLLDDAAGPHRDLLEALQRDSIDPFMEDRVAARIRAGRLGGVPIRRARLRPAGVLAALAVLVLASAASAMFWRAVKRRVATSAPAPTAPVTREAVHAPTPPVQQPAPPEAPPVAQSAPPPEEKPTPKHVAPRPAASAPIAEAPPSPALSDEQASQLLLDAYRALRSAHDPAAALAKVDDYLRLYPRGKLTEEALTLALEAAASAPHTAAHYAKQYLARFPDGPKAKQAAQLLEAENPN